MGQIENRRAGAHRGTENADRRGSDARYVPTGLGSPKRAEREGGHLVYALSGTMFAVAFDARRLEVKGGAVPIVEGVGRAAATTGAANFSFSSTGSLAYVPGPVSASSGGLNIALVDRKGGVEPLKLPPGAYVSPRVSPDGTRIAFGTEDGKEAIVWTYNLSGTSAMQRLTFGGKNRFPVWSSDGKRIMFQSDREGDLAIWWQPADGTGTAERLTKPDQGTSHVPDSWSSKSDDLLFNVTKDADVSAWILSLKDKKAMPFGGVHSSTPPSAVFSPDGHWVAYASTDQGGTTSYVQPFPATSAKYQILKKGGDAPNHPVWSPDGKELFYFPRAGQFEAVSVTTQPAFAFGNPVAVPRKFSAAAPGTRRPYDIAPGGKFVGLLTPGQTESAAPQIQVVLNWRRRSRTS